MERRFKVFSFTAIIIGLFIFLSFFNPFIVASYREGAGVFIGQANGFSCAFGGKGVFQVSIPGLAYIGTDTVKGNPVTMIAFIAVVVAFIANMISVFLDDPKIEKVLDIASAVLFLAAGVMVFLTKTMFVTANDVKLYQEYYSLTFNAIMTGILCILCACFVGVEIFKSFKERE